jgi:hypothetical protein
MKPPLAANRGGSGIMLAFDDELAKKTQLATEFEITVSPDNIVWTRRFRAEASPVLVDDLHRGKFFFFRVRSKNARGWGKCSKAQMTKVVTAPVPPVPKLPRFLSNTSQTITLALPGADPVLSKPTTPNKLTKFGSFFGTQDMLRAKSKTPLAAASMKKRRAAHGGTPLGGTASAYRLGEALHMNRRIAINSDDYEDSIHGVPDKLKIGVEYSSDRKTWISIEIDLSSPVAKRPLVLSELIPCSHYFLRVRQRNQTGWSQYNDEIMQIATRDFKVGDHVLWWNMGPWIKEPSWIGGVVHTVPDIAKDGDYGILAKFATKHVSNVRVEHIKETTEKSGEEAKHRWKLVSRLVATAKSFNVTEHHGSKFKRKQVKTKNSKQLLADRHDEVNHYLTLDDVGMTPGNRVNTAQVDSREEASAVSFKSTVKVLLFASKLRNKAVKSKARRGGQQSSGVVALVPLSGASTTDREMRRRMSFARMGMKKYAY